MLRWTNRLAALAVLGVGLVGCDGGGAYKSTKELPVPKADAHGHDEHAHGPHGGELVELGKEEFHAELVVDEKAHAIKAYLLGPDAKTAATTDAAELTIVMEDGKSSFVLKPAEGQPAGMAAEFVLADEKVVHDLLDAGFIHGDLKIKIGGTSYNGHLDVHFHGDHDHGDEMKKEDKPAETPTLIEPEKTEAPK